MDLPYVGGITDLTNDGINSPVSATTDSFGARKANALSAKLATVLSSSYADSEIREALNILDQRRLYNTKERVISLKADVQKEVIDANSRIIDDFGQVAEQLKRVGSLLENLNKTCDDMRAHILAAKQESAPVLEEASTLLARKREVEAKHNLLDAFRKHFLISDYDLNVLTNTTEPLNEDFFTILTRAKGIHRDCQILLGYENQRLGLELMEQTTRNLDAGFKKLYTWIQREFKTLDLEDPHISGSIRRALRVLSERPTLFQNCLDFFAEARQNTLAEAFQAALTGTGTGQAIEFSTHDPLRYIGDMLAWVHSTAVSEKEALEGLFIADADEISKGLATGSASEPWARIKPNTPSFTDNPDQDDLDNPSNTTSFDGRRALNDLISRNLSLASNTLCNRIDLATRNISDVVLIYKIYNLLTFYRDIFAKLLSSDSSTTKVILQLENLTLSHFEQTAEDTLDIPPTTTTILTTNATTLSPPPHLLVSLRQFTDILHTRGPQTTPSELSLLFTTLLTPSLDSCAETSLSLPTPTQSAVYKTNYLSLLTHTLQPLLPQIPAISSPLSKASSELTTLHSTLVTTALTTFLESSGVSSLLLETDTLRSQPPSRRKWLQENLEEYAAKLDNFLSGGLLDAQENLKGLTDKAVAEKVLGEAIEGFVGEFEEVEGLLASVAVEGEKEMGNGVARDEEGEDGDDGKGVVGLRELYPRSVAEVRALLS